MKEILKYRNDPIGFIERYIVVKTHEAEGPKLKNIILNDEQRDIIQSAYKYKHSINVCQRSIGKTTAIAAFITWYTIFNNDKTIGLLVNNMAYGKSALEVIKTMYDNLPFVYLEKGDFSIHTANGNWIFLGSMKDHFRSKTIDLLCADEFVFTHDFNSKMNFILQGMPKQTILISSGKRG